MGEYRTIKVEVKDRIATLTFNRPEKKNAMSPELHRETGQALDELAEDRNVTVLIVTGTGDAFCGGMDLEKCFLDTWGSPEKFTEMCNTTFRWHLRLRDFPRVSIASVNGWCFGGGFAVVGACDLAIASEKAIFGLSEVNMSFPPGGGALWGIAHYVLPRHALYYVLTGETFNGKEAARIGLVNKAVPHTQLRKETLRLANSIKEKNPTTLRLAKEAYRLSRGMDMAESIKVEMAKTFEASTLTRDEWIRALRRFRERRYQPGLDVFKKGMSADELASVPYLWRSRYEMR